MNKVSVYNSRHIKNSCYFYSFRIQIKMKKNKLKSHLNNFNVIFLNEKIWRVRFSLPWAIDFKNVNFKQGYTRDMDETESTGVNFINILAPSQT